MKLRTRLTLFSIAITLVVAAVLIYWGQSSQKRAADHFRETRLASYEVLWEKILDGEYMAMQSAVTTISRDRQSRNALKNKDQAKLAESARTTFNLLSSSEIISAFLLTDIEGNTLFEASELDASVDSSSLVRESLETGKIVNSLVKMSNGDVLAGVAFPLTMRGKPIGAGLFLNSIKKPIEELKNYESSEVFIVDDGNQVRFSTDEELSLQLASRFSTIQEQGISGEQPEDIYYQVAALPLENINQEKIGYLFISKDQTEFYAGERKANLVSYLLVSIVLVVSVVGLFLFISFSFKPLNELIRVLKHVSEGDLTQDVKPTSKDEIGELQQAIHVTVEQLRNMIDQIQHGTDHLKATIGNVMGMSVEMSELVSQQHHEIDQVVTAMTEMTATAEDVARSAASAASSASNADNQSAQGANVVQSNMRAINELAGEVEQAGSVIQQLSIDTESIGSVLDVIRSIAEQTNLLALNAAIEAARAGEQGRGFAVVADEVRTLASRTQESTQEIQQIIEQVQDGVRNAVKVITHSQEQARDGVHHSEQANEALGQIADAVSIISDMNIQIASAAEEQGAVVEEINRNIVNISEGANRSRTSTEGSVAEFKRIEEIAEKLTGLVGRFNV